MTIQQKRFSTQESTNVAVPLSSSMRAVRKFYGSEISNPEFEPDNLWIFFLTMEGAIDRQQLSRLLAFAVGDANQTIDASLAKGWIIEDEQGRIRLAEKSDSMFASMQETIQQANQQWRNAMTDGSENEEDNLNLFLDMLQHASDRSTKPSPDETTQPPITT